MLACRIGAASGVFGLAKVFRDADLQPFRNQAQDALVRDTVRQKTDRP
jgi:hypothetical protein